MQVHPLVNTLARPMVPLWACAMLVALIGCLIYSGLNWRLGNAAEPLLRSLYNMPLPQIMMNRRPSSPQALLDLRQRLNDVIAAGQLEVSDGAFGSKVIIPADKLFAEQGTVINPVGRALLARVSAAMKDVKGTILVSVFTDDQPVDGSRFASNYEFSSPVPGRLASYCRCNWPIHTCSGQKAAATAIRCCPTTAARTVPVIAVLKLRCLPHLKH